MSLVILSPIPARRAMRVVAMQKVRAMIDRVIRSSIVVIVTQVGLGSQLIYPRHFTLWFGLSTHNLQYSIPTGWADPLLFAVSFKGGAVLAMHVDTFVNYLNHLFTLLSFFRISLMSCHRFIVTI